IGLTANAGFLATLLTDPDVVAGTADTGLIEDRIGALTADAPRDEAAAVAAALQLVRAAPGAPGSPWYGQNGRGGFDRQGLAPDAPLGSVALVQEDEPRSVGVL